VSAFNTEISKQALDAWRLLRDEGGYWTASEVAQALMPGEFHSLSSARAGRWLSALHRRGHVAMNPSAIRVMAYGVTARCFVPAGESMDVALPSTSAVERLTA
jgi:hypothetical protein